MSINRLISFLLVLLVFSACSKQTDDTNILINIENEFTISMIETLSPSSNALNFRVTTIDWLDCSNYEIIHSHSSNSENIVTSIDYIQEPENCIEESTQITSDIRLGVLENGSYLFQLNLEKSSIINEGTLTIDDEKYVIELDSNHGIDLPVKRLNKIPANYIWGEINVAPNASDDLMDELFVELNQFTQESTLSPGDYGHFKIEDNSDFQLERDEDIGFTPEQTKSFIFKLPVTETALKDILNNYRNIHNNKIDIYVVTSEGEVL